MSRQVAPSFAALLTLTASVFAQGDPNQVVERPRPAEVAERVGKLLDGSDRHQLEVPGVKVDYARLPQDAHAVAMSFGETLSGAQDPRAKGLTLDRYVRIFEGQIQGLLDERLGDVGTVEVEAAIKLKSKEIAPGKYTLGVALQGGRIAGLVLREDGNPRARPIAIKMKPRRPELEAAEGGALTIALAPREGESGGFDIVCALRGNESITSAPITPAAAPASTGDEGDEDK